jgi:hypothetical protein
MEFDERSFDVDDAICAHDKKNDLDFDTSFHLSGSRWRISALYLSS